MTARELVVLGTASQAPTRERNHNGYLLRWDDEGILFDPGEGAQRGGRRGPPAAGPPPRRAARPPASGLVFFERLRDACSYRQVTPLRAEPVAEAGTVAQAPPFTLVAGRLDHPVET